MNCVGRWRTRQWSAAVEEAARGWEAIPPRQDRLAWQLEQWNLEWRRILATVPWYRDEAARHHWPSRFRTWEEVLARVPPVPRPLVQRHGERLRSEGRAPDFIRTTGGSTAEPVQLPAWKEELGAAGQDLWLARGWYGVSPAARLFMLWGHSHQLGRGWRGRWNAWLRQAKDLAAGYCRVSAYDLSEAALRRAADRLVAFQPDYLIGYSVALDRFARVNQDRVPQLRRLGLRVVVAAAEGFPFADSRARVEGLFGAPVAMEYGSVETNLIGHTHPGGGFRVFWRHYFVEAPMEGPVRVTSLYPRAFPLVRYELGDIVEPMPEEPERYGLARFASVQGRCHESVWLPDGRPVHSEAFTHVLRDLPAITGYQVARAADGLELRVLSSGPLTEVEAFLRERLGRIDRSLATIGIRRVEELERTVAGKTPMILRSASQGGSR